MTRNRRFAVGAILTAALTAGMLVQMPLSAVASTIAVESFDGAAAATWRVAGGSATITRVTGSITEGTGALQLGYSFGAQSLSEIGYVTTPAEQTGEVPARMKVDLKGDGTYNTAYVRLRDATGEAFMYKVGNLNVTTWSTYTIDLAAAPTYVAGGNGDGKLDAPVSLYRVNVARNGSQPASGSATFDNLRIETDGWNPLTSTATTFSAASDESTTLNFAAGTAGDWSIELADQSGHVRTFSGSVASAGPVSVSWNGRTAGGTVFAGIVQGVLRYDTALGGGLSTGALAAANPYLTGVTARPASTIGSIVGVNSFLTTIDDPTIVDAQAALMEGASVRFAREEFEWNRIEPSKGYFDFAKFDQAVESAQARGVEVIGKLVYSAAWASSAPGGTPTSQVEYYPPTSNADYAAYAAEVVERYKDTVHIWEIWNEPNLAAYWKTGPSGSAYGAMLKAAYTAIKAVDPTAIVLGGSLAGWSDSFMAAVHAAGAGSSYDGISLHTYSPASPESGASSIWIDGAYAFLQRTGNAGKSLWLTEMGWSSCSSGCLYPVSEVDQAAYLERSYVDAAAQGVRAICWFSLMEFGDSASRLDNFGLVERGGRKKPAYEALVRIGAALDQTVSTGSVSPTADGNFYVNDLASTSGFSVATIGGGSASLAAVTSRHSGTGSLSLSYSFTGASTGAEVKLNRPIAGTPTALSLWVYGDGSNAPVYMKVTDAAGEAFQAKVGHAAAATWERETFYFDGGNPTYTHTGGDNDGVIDYPITVSSVFVYRPNTGVQFGKIYLDDLTWHYGPVIRGAVVLSEDANTQLVYSMINKTIALPVAGTVATRQSGLAEVPLTVVPGSTTNTVTVSVGPGSVTTVNATALTSPNPAYVGEKVSVAWRGGDRGMYTIQVFSEAGVLQRTLASQTPFDSGRRTSAWTGTTSGGSVAPAGNYFFRLVLYGVDGRMVTFDTPFVLVNR